MSFSLQKNHNYMCFGRLNDPPNPSPRSTILDSNAHEEKSRRLSINGTDASQSVLPKLSSLRPPERWEALKSEPVGDEFVDKIRMQSTDSKHSLLKDLVKKAKVGF